MIRLEHRCLLKMCALAAIAVPVAAEACSGSISATIVDGDIDLSGFTDTAKVEVRLLGSDVGCTSPVVSVQIDDFQFQGPGIQAISAQVAAGSSFSSISGANSLTLTLTPDASAQALSSGGFEFDLTLRGLLSARAGDYIAEAKASVTDSAGNFGPERSNLMIAIGEFFELDLQDGTLSLGDIRTSIRTSSDSSSLSYRSNVPIRFALSSDYGGLAHQNARGVPTLDYDFSVDGQRFDVAGVPGEFGTGLLPPTGLGVEPTITVSASAGPEPAAVAGLYRDIVTIRFEAE